MARKFQSYLSKIKNPSPNIQNSFSSSKNWILSTCKHPKTQSFSIDRDQNQHNEANEATLSDIDRFLFENFRSLYLDDVHHQQDHDQRRRGDDLDDTQRNSTFLDDNWVLSEQSARFLELCRSDRFFVPPRSSGSLMEEVRASLTATKSEDIGSSSSSTNTNSDSTISYSDDVVPKKVDLPDDSIAVLKYSVSPCGDFRRSMQEMVDARLQHFGKVDWDFMEEILFCYLNLNEKKTHKFVLKAFVDVIIRLRQGSGKPPTRSRSSSRVAGERRRAREM